MKTPYCMYTRNELLKGKKLVKRSEHEAVYLLHYEITSSRFRRII